MNREQLFVGEALAGTSRSSVTGDDTRIFFRFFTWCASTVAAGVMLILVLTVVVDPYYLFRMVVLDGVNRIKPQPEAYREEIKLAQLRALAPDMIFFGNSRTEIGFDPDSPLIRTRGHSAYNIGLAGAGMAVSQRMLEQARDGLAPPALAIVGVEFLDFLVNPAAPRARAPSAELEFLAVPWQWRIDTVFSLGALADTLTTLRIQRVADVQVMTQRGYNPLREYNGFVRKEGAYAIFQQRAQENARSLVAKPKGLHLAGGMDSDSTRRLRAMLDRIARDGTEAHLIIYPYHAQLLAMFDEAGLHGTMAEWKRMLVQEADRVRARHPAARIQIWDFSGYGQFQCERIPVAGDKRSTTRWYWEGGHFKAALGEQMLQRVFGGAADFGLALTASTLEQNVQRIASERAQCASVYPALFVQARTLISKARSARQ